MPIDDGGGRRVLDDLELSAGYDVSPLDPVDVRGYLDDAVRVVPGEVGPDGVPGYDLGLVFAGPRTLEKLQCYCRQPVGLYSGHYSSLPNL